MFVTFPKYVITAVSWPHFKAILDIAYTSKVIVFLHIIYVVKVLHSAAVLK